MTEHTYPLPTQRNSTDPIQSKGPRTMGASRDFTTGVDTGVSTAVMERGRRVRTRGGSTVAGVRRSAAAYPPAARSGVRVAPEVPRRSSRTRLLRTDAPGTRNKRLGSQQQVSRRGRQLQPIKPVTLFSRLSALAIGLLIVGVALALWLSGISTSQAYRIGTLTATETQLDNQLETLNRDLENVRSSADVARRAADAKMGVPLQAGVVEVQANGDVDHKRPAVAGVESIIDVNGEPVRPGQASSDPNETRDISGSLQEVPLGQQYDSAAADAGNADREGRGQQPEAGGSGDRPAPVNAGPAIPALAPYASAAR